jgi:hypothetical protein
MMNIFICKNIKKPNDDSIEIKKYPIIKKDLEKEISLLKQKLTTRSSTQSLSFNKINIDESDEFDIIEYPEKEFINSKKLVNNYIYPKRKILDDDEDNYEINLLSESNIIYNINEYHNNDKNKNYYYNNKILNNEEFKNKKYCIYCEEIYKNAFEKGELIKAKNCIYCNRLVTQDTYEELINDGLFQSDDDDSIIENCKSHYGDN